MLKFLFVSTKLIKSITLLTTIFIFCFSITGEAKISEKTYLLNIKKYSKLSDNKNLEKTIKSFFKDYPNSKHIANTRLISAVYEPDPEKAVKKYKTLLKYYRFFKKNDFAELKLCELYLLFGQWKNLEIEAKKSIKKYPTSKYYYDYLYLLANSYFYMQNYDNASVILKKIIKENKNYHNIQKVKTLYSFIDYSISGNAKLYQTNLYRIHKKQKNNECEVSSLFLFGRFSEKNENYSKAYSAYKDVIKKYPRSPEAIMAKSRIKQISKYKPKYKTSYLKPLKTPKKIQLNILPEYEVKETKYSKNFFYTIAIGPFYNLKEAEKIKKIIAKDFKPIIILKKRKYFEIYINRFSSSEQAITSKIRLAEEFGFNGRIIYVKKYQGREYIYGD